MRGLNLLVFRDGRCRVLAADLRHALIEQLQTVDGGSLDSRVALLLRAGELECGVADVNSKCVLPFAELTDCLAEVLLGGQPTNIQDTKEAVARTLLPECVSVSRPEGFAYYALHPLAYAQVLKELPGLPKKIVVVGIRTIGATLSAVTAAGARLRGVDAVRFTVRPGGHPYNRHTEFSSEELQIIHRGISCSAGFLIVDEGPGLSGSSFLSVAEALEAAGVAQGKIVLLPAHEPNAETLCSANAVERWRRYRRVAVSGDSYATVNASIFVGGGQWRSRLLLGESAWPAVWSSMERVKYLVPADDRQLRLFKFSGLGHYGDSVFKREQRAAAAGFAPIPRKEEHGFVSYPWLTGRPMSANDLSAGVLARMAAYCAYRKQAFAIDLTDLLSLRQMAEHNLHELGFDLPVALQLKHPVIADGRMQPHEWILTQEGQILKTDSGSHGDDHFYPGATDIAWDLAGAIVEWQMNATESAEFLDVYRRASGDNAAARIDGFIRAYAVFRFAYCMMAANAMQGTSESTRLEQAAARYAALLNTDPRAAQQPAEEFAPTTLAPSYVSDISRPNVLSYQIK
ncbi:MAG TPA: hypothetical protein VJW20_11535 [Candidatus Angelobacter sp.]|nr:hypothetical protein [Candidatus Angelobacter sp.]